MVSDLKWRSFSVKKFVGAIFVVMLMIFSSIVPALASDTMPMSKMADLNKAAKSGIPYIVMVTSDTCTTCKDMKVYFPQFYEKYAGKVTFMMADSLRSRDIAAKFAVRVVPTTLFFDEYGDLVNSYVGAITEDQMINFMIDLGFIEDGQSN